MNEEEFIDFLIRHKEDIIFEKSEIDEKYLTIVNNLTTKEKMKEIDKHMRRSGTIKASRKESFNNSVMIERKLFIMKEVTLLKEGDSFGELALMSNKPRAATIYCKGDPTRRGME